MLTRSMKSSRRQSYSMLKKPIMKVFSPSTVTVAVVIKLCGLATSCYHLDTLEAMDETRQYPSSARGKDVLPSINLMRRTSIFTSSFFLPPLHTTSAIYLACKQDNPRVHSSRHTRKNRIPTFAGSARPKRGIDIPAPRALHGG